VNSYPDSVRYLYSLGNEIKTVKFGLDTIREVLERLGNPQLACRYIHVAGTNGKGSTCAMIEAALRVAGVRTGLYTSPHLIEPTERIQIAGVPVSEAEFVHAFDVVHQAAIDMETHPTYFETVTAMAFVLFRERTVDRVVLEVGLGGRLDATNVVTPELCVITPIDYDHEAWLGNTIEAIAAEKAGILKPGVPAVIARQRPEAEQVIAARAAELHCRLIRAADFPPADIQQHPQGNDFRWQGREVNCPLAGAHQVDNAVTALLALRELSISAGGIAQARWPGRLEYVSESPDIILDGAHNPAGVRALTAYIERHFTNRKVWLIYATMRDKSVGEIADTLFPLAEELIVTAADSPRSLDPDTLLRHCGHPKARAAANLAAALSIVRAEAAPQDAIFISGSLYLVGEARALLVQ
jgi:dihydrofolate synthase/folylpolyglutamate synthase